MTSAVEELRRQLNADPAAKVLAQFVLKYRHDPVLFVREVLGVVPDPWQVQVLEAYAKRPVVRQITVRSCHGPGKTAVAAWMAVHHMLVFFPQRTVVTAPTTSQCFDSFYSEVKIWMKRLPDDLQKLFEIKGDHIELIFAPEASYLAVRTSRKEQPEALQGVHSEHVLLIVDEASGVPEEVFAAASGSMSDEKALTLLISNPTKRTGLFFDSHHTLKGSWVSIHVGWKDSPRVSAAFEQEIRERYGEDSNEYRVRVLGEFPKEDADAVIPWELIDEATRREITLPKTHSRVWGLDCAWQGKDRSALVVRAGPKVLGKSLVWKGLDPMQLSGRVVDLWNNTPLDERPSEILVDMIGIGAGTVSRLQELGLPARGINVAETPGILSNAPDLRTELWEKALGWFRSRGCSIPADDVELIEELSMPGWEYRSNGKKAVESKEKTKLRHTGKKKRSPDIADAFILTFASDQAALVSGQLVSWNQPLKRNLKGIV